MALLIRIKSAKVESKLLAYLIWPESNFRGDQICCDTGMPSLQSCSIAEFLCSFLSALECPILPAFDNC